MRSNNKLPGNGFLLNGLQRQSEAAIHFPIDQNT